MIVFDDVTKENTKKKHNQIGIYKNIEEYKPNKKCKILIVFDDIIADMLTNKKVNPVVTELFITGRN